MRRWSILTSIWLVCFGYIVDALPPQAKVLQLILTRKYGYAGYQECRIDINVTRGSVALNCLSNNRPPLNVEKALSTMETQTLSDLVLRSNFFEGAQGTGKDQRPVDGVFETLEVRSGSTVVVVVTSGNLRFEEDGSRKQLLDLIKSIEQRLRSGTN
jgi:hypothetical protein